MYARKHACTRNHARTSRTHSLPYPLPRTALSGHPAQTPSLQIRCWHPRKEKEDGGGEEEEEEEMES